MEKTIIDKINDLRKESIKDSIQKTTVEKLIASEKEAIQEYQQALSEPDLSQNEKKMLEEILNDEKDHLKMLENYNNSGEAEILDSIKDYGNRFYSKKEVEKRKEQAKENALKKEENLYYKRILFSMIKYQREINDLSSYQKGALFEVSNQYFPEISELSKNTSIQDEIDECLEDIKNIARITNEGYIGLDEFKRRADRKCKLLKYSIEQQMKQIEDLPIDPYDDNFKILDSTDFYQPGEHQHAIGNFGSYNNPNYMVGVIDTKIKKYFMSKEDAEKYKNHLEEKYGEDKVYFENLKNNIRIQKDSKGNFVMPDCYKKKD